jgi:protein-S-isoprenylcysteine O-methyltransferase Ste14
LAALFLIVSGYLAKKGLAIVFGEKIEKPAVIRKSVFGAVRHPIYLGEILFFLGFLGLSLSLAATAVWVVAVAFLHS